MQDAARPGSRIPPLAGIIAFALLLRLALTPLYAHLPGHFTDEMYWKQWMQAIHEHGVLNVFRTTSTDYVGYHWLLWPLAIVYSWIGGPYTQSTPSLHVLVKMPPILFDVALIVAVHRVTLVLVETISTRSAAPGETRRQAASDEELNTLTATTRVNAQHVALAAAAVIALQPAIVYDSAVWAQPDSAVALAMLVAIVMAATGRPATGWAVWALGFMLKPQPIIIVPVLLVLTLRYGRGGIVRSAAAASAVVAIVLGPWILHGDAIRILKVYNALFRADYEGLSAAAWNLWWFRVVAAHPPNNDRLVAAVPLLTYRFAASLLFATAGLIGAAFVALSPRLKPALIAASYVAFAFYILAIPSHDRYLYPFLALLLPVAMIERRWLWWYVPASVTFLLNLLGSAPPADAFSGRWLESPFSLAVAAVNVLLFASMTAWMLVLVARELALVEGQSRTDQLRSFVRRFDALNSPPSQ